MPQSELQAAMLKIVDQTTTVRGRIPADTAALRVTEPSARGKGFGRRHETKRNATRRLAAKARDTERGLRVA